MMLNQRAIVITHGVLGSLAWVIFFPLGSVLVRTLSGPSTWKVHAFVQLFSMAMFTAAVGTGWQMAKRFRMLDNYHVVIGFVIFGLMFIQAAGGMLHHIIFKTQRQRTVVSYIHLWLGRIMITLGMINGGLGLWINGRSTTAENIAYGTVAAVIWLAYLITSAICEARRLEPCVISLREERLLAREKRIERREARARLTHKEKMMKETVDWISDE